MGIEPVQSHRTLHLEGPTLDGMFICHDLAFLNNVLNITSCITILHWALQVR